MKAAVIVALVIVVVIVLSSSMYTVREGEQAVITRFGKLVKEVTEAGLNFKTPFIEKVNRLEKRLLPWDGDPEDLPTGDKKRVFIDVWARWRISEPMQYFQRVGTEQGGYAKLDSIVDSAVRDVIARRKLIEAVRSSNRELTYESEELAKDAASPGEGIEYGREKMEQAILEIAQLELEGGSFGMELTEVHIKRIDYVENVRQTVYTRMQSERQRIARLYESEAEEETNKIVGLTRKELDEIEGEMQQESTRIRGEADAEVIQIAADAYSQSPEFYEFLKRLELYRTTLGKGARLVLSTDNPLLDQLLGKGAGVDTAAE